MKGVPLRVEIGPRDIENNQVVFVRRDTNEKYFVPIPNLESEVRKVLDEIQSNLLEMAKEFLADNTHQVKDYEDFKKVLLEKRGMIKSMWCGSAECEAQVKTETLATIRCIPFEQEKVGNQCIKCGKDAEKMVYFARAY